MKINAQRISLFLVLLLTFLFLLISCREKGGSIKQKKIKIGLSFATLAEERWTRERNTIVDEASKLGMQTIVLSAEKDEMLQNNQIENMVAQKVKAIIIVAQNADAIASSVSLAKDEGIPTIAYDRAIYSNDISLYISFDSIKVGYAEAKALLNIVNRGRFLILCGSPTDDNAYLIRKGQYSALQPYIKSKKIKIIGEYWCDGWSPEDAMIFTENALTANQNNIQAILAPNDGTAGGAIQALAAQGLAGKIPVSGEDAELAACQRIVNGTQTVTVFKDIRKLAKEAVFAAWELARGKKPSKINSFYQNAKKGIKVPSIILDVVPVTKDNLNDIIIKSGFHKHEDVYANSK